MSEVRRTEVELLPATTCRRRQGAGALLHDGNSVPSGRGGGSRPWQSRSTSRPTPARCVRRGACRCNAGASRKALIAAHREGRERPAETRRFPAGLIELDGEVFGTPARPMNDRSWQAESGRRPADAERRGSREVFGADVARGAPEPATLRPRAAEAGADTLNDAPALELGVMRSTA